MADFQIIGSDVKKLRAAGAPQADIDLYLQSQGIDMATLEASGFGPPKSSAGRSAILGATQGVTYGFGDEVASAIAATVGRPGGEAIPGKTWPERYQSALNIARPQLEEAAATNPWSYHGAEIAAGIVPSVLMPEATGANWIAGSPTKLAMANRSGVVAAGNAALNALGRSSGSPAKQATETAAAAAVAYPLGFVAPTIIDKATQLGGKAVSAIGKITGLGANKAPAPLAASQIAKEAGSVGYNVFDNAGVILKPEAVQRLNKTIVDDLADWGIDEGLQPGATRAIKRIGETAASGENVSLKGIELLRRVAGRVNNPQNPSEGEAASKIIDHIDDFMEKLDPTDVVQGDVGNAMSVIKEARANWSAFRKAKILEDAVVMAQDRAGSTGTGGNLVNAVRQNLRRILDNPKKVRGFTAAEIDEIRSVVRGGPLENIARMAAAFAPSRGGVNSWMALLAQSIPGVGQAVPVLGEAAHKYAKDAVLKEAQQLPQMILSRSPAGSGMVPAPPYSATMAKSLSHLPPLTGLASQWLSGGLMRPRGTSQ